MCWSCRWALGEGGGPSEERLAVEAATLGTAAGKVGVVVVKKRRGDPLVFRLAA